MEKIISGQYDLLKQTRAYDFLEVLDIGFGNGFASEFFLSNNKKVSATGLHFDKYIVSQEVLNNVKLFENVFIEDLFIFNDSTFDAVWCSHVIEHVQNVGIALKEVRRVLKTNGILFLMVPPFKQNLVGGHLTTGWSITQLMYNLLLSGFDIKNGSFIKHKYNVAGFVRKKDFELPELIHDKGDIEKLRDFFPVNVFQNIILDINKINWVWNNK
jgi:SAM-dependent methyltransferase